MMTKKKSLNHRVLLLLLVASAEVCCGFVVLPNSRSLRRAQRFEESLKLNRVVVGQKAEVGINEEKEKSGRELLSELFRLGLPYYRETDEGKWALGKVVGLTLLQSGVSVAISYISRDFYNALSAKDLVQFQEILIKFGAALLVAVPVTVLYRFEREQLSLKWRKWMTADVLTKYAENRKFYEIEDAVDIDNPDQRITQDIDSFTAVSLSFGITALTSVIDLFSFSSILYSIFPPLFGAIVAYAALGTGLTAYVGRSLPSQNFQALRTEADFRYALVRLRENAEAIAFYNGAKREEGLAKDRLDSAVEAQSTVINTQRNLEFVTVAYRFLVQILPIAVVAPLYFQGKIELGIVTQSSSAFNHVLNDLSQIINQFESIAAFGAGLDRLSTFVSRLEQNNTTTSQQFVVEHDLQTKDELVLLAQDLEVRTPDNRRILVADLNLELRKGQRLLLVGASGAGKSSILRALAGLWQPSAGRVSLPPDAFFLPQKPYCTLGTLADQLLYPRTATPQDDNQELRQALKDVGLSRLIPRLHETADWTNTLSLGEQQRLAFARLFLARPSLAVADEATSALDVDAERHLYNLLESRLGSDLALVSVGHRPSLLEHHDFRLRLSPVPESDLSLDTNEVAAPADDDIPRPPAARLEAVSTEDRDAASRLTAV